MCGTGFAMASGLFGAGWGMGGMMIAMVALMVSVAWVVREWVEIDRD